MKTRKNPASNKVRVVYVDPDGCAYNRPPTHKQARQLTREELDRLAVKNTVIIEKVD
jgi:hypothetical protein